MKIHGTLISLTPLTKNHIPKCWEWICDKKVTKFLGNTFPNTYQAELKWFREMQKKKDERMFAILDKETGKHIGNIGLHEISKKDKNATIGIMIGEPKYWNKGYGTDALKTALRYCFKRLKLNKVRLDVRTEHKAAQKCYKKVGFKRTGTAQDEYFKEGKFHDVFLMEILAKDF